MKPKREVHTCILKSNGKGRMLMDLNALLAEKKKKAMENNKSFQKNMKSAQGNNNQRQMPMRKSGRGK